jgi:hypothetical protein
MRAAIIAPCFGREAKEKAMTTTHLSQTDLANRWRMSPRTLERWRFTGEGPQFIKLGGRVVYRLEDIEAFEIRQIRQFTPGITRGAPEPGIPMKSFGNRAAAGQGK